MLYEVITRRENVELKERVEKKYRLVGNSEAMARVRAEIAAAGPTNASVLVAGENGSGKEIVARITSYNVCYTKLLRMRILMAWLAK